MLRFLAILCLCASFWMAVGRTAAQPTPGATSAPVATLLAQNPLLAQVGHVDRDALWDLVKRLQLIVVGPLRDAGSARGTAAATTSELAAINANPAFGQAYRNDPAATLDLLREAEEDLRHARSGDAQGKPKRIALVVGSGANSAWGHLATTTNDANLVATTLRSLGFTLFAGAALINPDRQSLEEAIKSFTHEIGPNTVALFYFAGHGAFLGDNYLVPSDAPVSQTIGDMNRDLIDVDGMVLPSMRHADGRLSIVVLDACRDNPLSQSLMLAMRGGRQQYQGLGSPHQVPDMTGVVVMYSAAPGHIALDRVDRGDTNSPFTAAFARAITQQGLELRDVVGDVHDAVVHATHNAQDPWTSFGVNAGHFYFSETSALSSLPPLTPTPSPTAAAREPESPPQSNGSASGSLNPGKHCIASLGHPVCWTE